MPSRDRRLNPDLERALPADSVGYTDWEHVGRLHEALFGDGAWHPVTVKARWRDRRGTAVVQLAWTIGGESYGESYLADPERIREA
jgi:hypothetical protein